MRTYRGRLQEFTAEADSHEDAAKVIMEMIVSGNYKLLMDVVEASHKCPTRFITLRLERAAPTVRVTNSRKHGEASQEKGRWCSECQAFFLPSEHREHFPGMATP